MSWLVNLVLNRVGLDQLIAMALNWLLTKVAAGDKTKEYYQKSKVMLQKGKESLDVALSILSDDVVLEEEVVEARKKLVEIWARGEDSVELRVAARLIPPEL